MASDPSPARPRGPYAKTAAVRARILRAASEVFAEAGYRATTMKQVAERAEMSQRGLVHHFATKDDLLFGVLRMHEEARALYISRTGPRSALESILRGVEQDSTLSGLVQLQSLLSAEATAADHPAHAYYRTRYERARHGLASVFADMKSRGEIRVDMRPAELASTFLALLDGLQVQWLYAPQDVDVPGVTRRFLRTVLVHGASDRALEGEGVALADR